MPRVKRGFKARRRRNRILKEARGYYGGRSRLFKTATEAVDKAGQYAYVGRKLRKRDFRRLWQIRIGAAAKAGGTSYSKLMGSLAKKEVALNRKMLAQVAALHPADFGVILEMAAKN